MRHAAPPTTAADSYSLSSSLSLPLSLFSLFLKRSSVYIQSFLSCTLDAKSSATLTRKQLEVVFDGQAQHCHSHFPPREPRGFRRFKLAADLMQPGLFRLHRELLHNRGKANVWLHYRVVDWLGVATVAPSRQATMAEGAAASVSQLPLAGDSRSVSMHATASRDCGEVLRTSRCHLVRM